MPHDTLPKVAVLLSSAGGGHKASAESLAQALEGRAEVLPLNLLDEHTPFPVNRVSASYGPLVNRAPRIYRAVFRSTQRPATRRLVERGSYHFVRRRMRTVLLAADPDLVISVHPLLTTVPLRLLRSLGSRAPFVTCVTDAATIPQLWFAPGVDLCCVADEEVAESAVAAGVPRAKVAVTGLPVRRSFPDAAALPKTEARRRLGMAPDLPLVLLTGGGGGVGRLEHFATAVADSLGASGTDAGIAVVTGANTHLRRRLEARRWPVPATILGYTDRMAEWMAASDIMLSKAGPGTIAEAACVGLPLILTGFIPGQEEGNVDWAARHGRALFAPHAREAAASVVWLLGEGAEDLEAMAGAMRGMARCGAAMRVADLALGLLRR